MRATKSKRSAGILSLILMVAALFLCPLTRPIFGFSGTAATEAVQIYYWVGTILFVLLALVEFPFSSTLPKRIGKYGIMLVLIFTSIEVTCAVVYRTMTGRWAHTIAKNQNQFLFEEHPQLIGTPIKNASQKQGDLVYSHNSQGFRGEGSANGTSSEKIRIVALGGSTTYGVGVNNEDTWPAYLAQELGSDYEVINMGVPGYSSRENLLQTELYLSELHPAIAIYCIGLNDLRNINIENLKADYSDFHQPSLYGAFGLCENENLPPLAVLKILVLIGQKSGLVEICPNQAINIKTKKHTGVDEHALSIYEHNLQRIIKQCKMDGIKPVFVPQILLEEVLKTGDYSWWIPYVPTEEMDDMMAAYNTALRAVADSNDIPFVDGVIEHKWTEEDFVDLSHFTPEANRKLAALIAKELRTELEADE